MLLPFEVGAAFLVLIRHYPHTHSLSHPHLRLAPPVILPSPPPCHSFAQRSIARRTGRTTVCMLGTAHPPIYSVHANILTDPPLSCPRASSLWFSLIDARLATRMYSYATTLDLPRKTVSVSPFTYTRIRTPSWHAAPPSHSPSCLHHWRLIFTTAAPLFRLSLSLLHANLILLPALRCGHNLSFLSWTTDEAVYLPILQRISAPWPVFCSCPAAWFQPGITGFVKG